MKKPIVHLYTICWNEAPMLPFFFRHYDEFIDQYVFFDDASTDDTPGILQRHPKAELRPLVRPDDFESCVLASLEIYNNCWKESIGKADWVIITDVDEQVYHKDLITYVSRCQKDGVTLIPGMGYQMISRHSPKPERKLTETVTRGAPYGRMNKLGLFDPNGIVETNFGNGRHEARPAGTVVYPASDEVLILHYKYLSLGSTHRRHLEEYEKLGKLDKKMGWGHKYSWAEEELNKDWERFEAKAVDNVLILSTGEHMALHSGADAPWWRRT